MRSSGYSSCSFPRNCVRARSTAKGVLRTLGAARDFDVQLAELERYCASLPALERLAAAPLRARLEADRHHARVHMIRTLDGEATRSWLQTLRHASTSASAASLAGAVPAAIVMPERVQKRFRRLRRDVRGLDPKAAMEKYHVVRRRAKLLRYALEPGAELFGKPADELLKALRRLQDGLGEHQDAHLAKNRLKALAADSGAGLPAETLFLMGRLAEHNLNVTTQGAQDSGAGLEENPRQALEGTARADGAGECRSTRDSRSLRRRPQLPRLSGHRRPWRGRFATDGTRSRGSADRAARHRHGARPQALAG